MQDNKFLKNKETKTDSVVEVNGVYKVFSHNQMAHNSIKNSIVHAFSKKDKKLSKDEFYALKDINFTVNKGDFFGIVGRNGSGKSTMLKILAGIYQPTKGSVSVKGKLVPFIELGVGFNPELTGHDNVYLNGALLGFSKKEVDGYYDRVVSFAELEDFMDQKLRNYSSGMQVRLAFACATVSEADILLVDEVLAVGDSEFQRKCFSYFKYLKRKKITVVFVTHDMNAVREYCNKAILIEQNEIRIAGSPDEVSKEYTKLFMQEDPQTEDAISDKKSKRWGNQAITIKNIIHQGVIRDTDKTTKITVVYQADQDIENPIFGFTIKDESGVALFGTNTKIRNVTPFSMSKNEKIEIDWEFPNIFNDGAYFFEPAVVQDDGSTVCDWWEEAVKLIVKKSIREPYPLSPDIDIVKRGVQ